MDKTTRLNHALLVLTLIWATDELFNFKKTLTPFWRNKDCIASLNPQRIKISLLVGRSNLDPNFQGLCRIVHLLSRANSQNSFSSWNVTFSKKNFPSSVTKMDIKQYHVLRIWSSHFKFGDSDIGDLKLARIFGCFEFCRRFR